jgi:pimeloyl-ACP methyl ester carboxylesterase
LSERALGIFSRRGIGKTTPHACPEAHDEDLNVNARVDLVAGGAHMMPLEEPAKLAATVAKFVKG